MKLVTVIDIKGGYHYPVQCYKTISDALRAFQTACETETSIFNQFPTDFSLLELGEFDELSGEISPINKKLLASASEFVRTKTTTLSQLPVSEMEARN